MCKYISVRIIITLSDLKKTSTTLNGLLTVTEDEINCVIITLSDLSRICMRSYAEGNTGIAIPSSPVQCRNHRGTGTWLLTPAECSTSN